MPTEPYKPKIFVSYAHADEPEKPAADDVKWASFVIGYLRPADKHGIIELWIDQNVRIGDDWDPEIERKVRECDIFLLLVSNNSLSSDYIVHKEIPIIRERLAKGEDVRLCPLLVKPTLEFLLDLVRDRTLRPRDGKPLSDYSINERYRHVNDIVNELVKIAADIASRMGSAPARPPLPPPQSPAPTASAAPRAVAGSLVREGSVALHGVGSKASAGEFAATVNANKGFETSAPVGASPLSPPSAERQQEAEPQVESRASLEAWLRKQPRETAITIAARAALRVAPLVGRASRQLGDSTGATFRAIALARVAGKYPARASELRTDAAATYNAAFAAASEDDAAYAAFAAADTAAAAAAAYADAAAVAFAAASAVHHAADAARAVDTGYDALWVEVRADAYAVAGDDASAVADMQLWSGTRPEWARVAWDKLVAALLIDEDWDVWIDWYEERLDGGSRGEAYEVVFASVPREEWDKGPAAANAWIKGHLPREESLEVGDGFSLEAWLSAQNRETAIAIAVRAALRVAPLAARIARKGMGLQQQRELTHVAAVIFRALASAHVSVHDPDRTFISSALNAAGASADSSVVAIVAEVARAAMFATSAAANSAAAAAAANPNAPRSAAAAVRAFVDAFVSADLSASDADTAAWNEILSDIEATQRDGVLALLEAPLWRQREPGWVRPALDILEAELPGDEGWDVWFDWYKQRLRGGSRGDDFELVFASVPLDVWDSGPAAANVWIREHLPRLPIDESHAKPVISDKELLEAWLSGQSREAAIAIAARAALRVAPLAVRLSRNHQSVEAFEDVATLASAIFRSCASARTRCQIPGPHN